MHFFFIHLYRFFSTLYVNQLLYVRDYVRNERKQTTKESSWHFLSVDEGCLQKYRFRKPVWVCTGRGHEVCFPLRLDRD